jgi:transcriptional regulator with XRE-family HTH domain
LPSHKYWIAFHLSPKTITLALPFCHICLKAEKPKNPAYPESLNSLGDHIRKRRLDLKLLQKEVAKRLEVDTTTITNWELNRTSPSLPFIPRIIEFLGYVPTEMSPSNPGELIAFSRKLLGMSQERLAQQLEIDPGTLGRWEKGKNRPSLQNWKKLRAVFLSIAWLNMAEIPPSKT